MENQIALKNLSKGINIFLNTLVTRPQDVTGIFKIGSSFIKSYGCDGVPVLVVPSLINANWILDLSEVKSFMNSLKDQGMRPFLIDWGAPSDVEYEFGLQDYVQRLLEFSNYIFENYGKHKVVGYCMGGNLAIAACVMKPQNFSSISTIATPWGFSQTEYQNLVNPIFITVINSFDKVVSGDFIKRSFFYKDMFKVIKKYEKLGAGQFDIKQFVDIEQWVNYDVAVAKNVFLQIIELWIAKDALMQRKWEVDGVIIDPTKIKMPLQCFVAEYDNISRIDDCLKLSQMNASANIEVLKSGHIGMILDHADYLAKAIYSC